jgi:hypothetical protein
MMVFRRLKCEDLQGIILSDWNSLLLLAAVSLISSLDFILGNLLLLLFDEPVAVLDYCLLKIPRSLFRN